MKQIITVLKSTCCLFSILLFILFTQNLIAQVAEKKINIDELQPGEVFDITKFKVNSPAKVPTFSFTKHEREVMAGALPELLYYKFNETGTANTANLANPGVGNNPAALLGGLTLGGAGEFGSALVGTGGSSSTDYVDSGWPVNLPPTGFTISFWMNNMPNNLNLYYLLGDATANSFRIFIGGVAGAGNIIIRGGDLTDLIITGISGGPHVVHFVYDGTNILGYLDGALQNTVADALVNVVGGAGPLKVGGYSGTTGMPAGSFMDELRIYNRALGAAEIAATWNVELGGPINAAPVLAGIEGTSLEYTGNSGAKVISNSITITDTDDTDLEGAVVQITSNYIQGEDILQFLNFQGIAGTWDNNTGKMTLTGTASLAVYEIALRNVKYKNLLENPTLSERSNQNKLKSINATPRTVSFKINDGDSDSNVLTRDIKIVAANKNPMIIVNTGVTLDKGNVAAIDVNMLQATDDDGSDLSIRFYVTQLPLHGVLSKTAFTQNDINNGEILYTHDGTNSTEDSFIFNLQDGEGDFTTNYTFLISINLTAPYQPTNLTWSSVSNGIKLQWQDNSKDEDGFCLWRQDNSNAKLDIINEYQIIATLQLNSESYTDTDVEEGVVYYYQITAFNSAGSSGVATGENSGSTVAIAPLNGPSHLQATDNGDGSITIIWEDNSGSEQNYVIERKYADDWSLLYLVEANIVTYTDTQVDDGTTYYYRVKAVNSETESEYSNETYATCTITGSEEWISKIPSTFSLAQNYPNPFNPNTVIRYGLPEDSNVNITVYNMLGQKVAVLVNKIMSAGYHEVIFGASKLNSGIYLYRIEANNFVQTNKMILIK